MPPEQSRRRILNQRLAAALADLRHGEMIFVADAGSGTHPKALRALDSAVEVLDLGVSTGVPGVADLVAVMAETGDLEAAIVTNDMERHNPEDLGRLVEMFGAERVHKVNYIPDFYDLRDECKLFVQTGDYKVHANVIVVGGYPSADIPIELLLGKVRRP